jgi:hypothetical protein
MNVDLVWKRPEAEGLWLCGLAVAESHRPAWRQAIEHFPSAAA